MASKFNDYKRTRLLFSNPFVKTLLNFPAYITQKLDSTQPLTEFDEFILPIHPQRWEIYQLALHKYHPVALKIRKIIENSKHPIPSSSEILF